MEGTAEATYRQWLTRQYAAFLESLRGLTCGGAAPAVQVLPPAHKPTVRPPAQARAFLSLWEPQRGAPFRAES